MGLSVKDKEIVVPGEELAQGMDYLPSYGTFRDGETIVAGRLGMVSAESRIIKLIPLAGKYLPKTNDTIIGRVFDVTMSGWMIDINSAYSAMLGVKDAVPEFVARGTDLTKYFSFGDYLVTRIINVTSKNFVDLTLKGPGLKKLGEGRIIHVSPHKVPRIIGKQGSMISMIKDSTNCRIVIGQNGIGWVQGEPEDELVAIQAIRKVEDESHTSGLTERIKEFLDRNKRQ
ncbi:RNA-binding protein [Candidatus Woesearchaeota archaeon]|nr:RNA-binding protein [Candidatus Woesearchaeota archaeon]